MNMVRSQKIRHLYRSLQVREISYLFGSSTSYSKFASKVPRLCDRSISTCTWHKSHDTFPWILRSAKPLHSTMSAELSIFTSDMRSLSTQAKTPTQAQRQAAVKLFMLSPGMVYEPYAPRESISFWKRWFTRSGWRRTKEDVILELRNAFAIAKIRKSGYSKQQFYQEALQLYKEINSLMASGNKAALRKVVTENMYSALKNEIKHRESMWSSIYWELVEPVDKIRTLRARLICIDRDDHSKVFAQLTLEFLAKQKFEACNSKGTVVAGDKTKEVLVRDIWVFEKSLFHPGAYWRLCGRLKL